jgi:tRNA pseudouridine32 synthase/23S rRNA pseudouridine746 synthase
MKTFKILVGRLSPTGSTLGDVLAKVTKFDMKTLDEAAVKGAVWVQKGKGKILRERKLARKLGPDETVTFFYDPKVLSLQSVETPRCLFENSHYGIWYKASGVVPQGTQTGDHASLLRAIEIIKNKEAYLVHRLDRETAGLMIFAYTADAAKRLGDLFQKNQIKKEYEAIVLGEMSMGEKGIIDVALEDKKAVTHYEVLDSKNERALLRVIIDTGRLHQIRRHLLHINHPVMGDPKYGHGNKNREGLRLLAKSLSFKDPWTTKTETYVLEQGLSL